MAAVGQSVDAEQGADAVPGAVPHAVALLTVGEQLHNLAGDLPGILRVGEQSGVAVDDRFRHPPEQGPTLGRPKAPASRRTLASPSPALVSRNRSAPR